MDSAQRAEATTEYYARRAAEYDRIYAKPERQDDLARLREHVRRAFSGREVLELACGTGYWTAVMADSARRIVASDINEEMLAVARSRDDLSGPGARAVTTFVQADLYAAPVIDRTVDSMLVAHWWSHVERGELGRFLDALDRQLPAGALVMALDNRYVEGSSTPVSRTDEAGNTFQQRRLDDGSTYEVLKNFPSAEEFAVTLGERGADLDFVEFDYYWAATWRLAGRA